MSEGQVSDVYVRLGNDFNAAVAAFAAFNIDMACVKPTFWNVITAEIYNRELMSVPDDLRNVLEQCLAEDATPENLEIYLPTVRQIITNLLQGLRGKQSIYRRIVSDHRHKSTSSEQSTTQQRTSSRTSRSDRTSRREGDTVRTHRSQLSRTILEDEKSTESESTSSRRSGQSIGKRKEHVSHATTASTDDETVVASDNGIPERSATPSQSVARRQQQPTSPPLPAIPTTRSRSASVVDDSIPRSSSRAATLAPAPEPEKEPLPPPPLPPPQVPSNMKRYSLVDKPVSPPQVFVEESSDNVQQRMRSPSPPEMPPLDSLTAPAMANSLAALKKSDVLERRASKRFSTYNISKITGGSTGRDRSLRSNNTNRRSLAASSTLTPVELNVLTEEDEEDSSPTITRKESVASLGPGAETSPAANRGTPPPPPQISSSPSLTPPSIVPPSHEPATETTQDDAAALAPSSSSSRLSFPVFLQLGREVKKL